MADDAVQVQIGGEASGAIDAAQQTANALKEIKDAIGKVTEGAAEFKDALLQAFTVEGVLSFIEAMTSAATATERLTTALGTTTFQVATLDIASKSAGTSVTAISEMMTRLENNVARATAGIERSKDALGDFGLKASQFKGLDLAQKIDLVASTLAKFKDGTEKTAAAQQLLGGGVAYLLPILNRGAGAFEEYAAVVKRSAVEATPEFLNEMSRLDLKMIESRASLAGLGMTIATAFGPALSGLAGTFAQVVQGITNSIRQGGLFAGVLNALTTAAQAFATAVAVAVAGAQILGEVYTGMIKALADNFMSLGTIIKSVFTFQWAAASAAFTEFTTRVGEQAKKTGSNIVEIYKRTAENIKATWTKAAAEVEKVDQDQDVNRKRRNADAVAAAILRSEAEIAALRDGLKQKQALLEFEVSMGAITQNQKFAQLMAYTAQEYQAEYAALQQQLNIQGLRVQQRQQILNRLAALERQHSTDMINLDRQSFQAQLAIVKQYTDAVAGAFTSQLRGILTGQTSFSQAMKNILLDLSVKTIELIAIKPAAEFIARQIAMTTANQTGAAARAASDVAAAEAALPAKIAAFTSDITARAALTFAGVFANLAPLLGPGAAVPAAASEATVMAQLAAVPKFDVGSWSVPKTGLAVVHKGEFIAPAGSPSEAVRNQMMGAGGGGAGATHHWNISAWDGQSVDRWLRSGGADKMARAVSRHQDLNPSSRPQK